MIRSGIGAVLLVLLSTFALAAEPMGVQDVLDLLEAGVSERVVIAQIEASGADFRLDTDEIVRLEEMGVGERIIEAMIRSGSEAESYEEEAGEEEAVAAVVPAHLGFYRYNHSGSVAVRMVPWSVPQVTLVYGDWDPWFWDPWWWDTNYYVSYNYYPWYRPAWHASSWWHNPRPWWYWRDAHGWRDPHPHHGWGHGSPHGATVARETYWKKKGVHRDPSSPSAASSHSGRYRTDKRGTTHDATPGTRYRKAPSRTSGRETPGVSSVSRKRTRSEASQPKVSAPVTRGAERIAPSRGATRGSSPSPSATRAPSSSSGRGSGSSSSGGRKHTGR